MCRLRYFGLIDVRIAGNSIAPADSSCNFVCEFLAVRSSLGICSLGRVGEEAAFHEHCRNVGFSQYVITPAAHSAVGGRRTPSDEIMDG